MKKEKKLTKEQEIASKFKAERASDAGINGIGQIGAFKRGWLNAMLRKKKENAYKPGRGGHFEAFEVGYKAGCEDRK